MRKILLITVALICVSIADAQDLKEVAKTISQKYKIPEIAFAVVSSEQIIEIEAIGKKRVDSEFQADLADRFHIGSNTKAITSFVAALLVKDGKISWSTKFFDLFPELKRKSRKAYFDVTIQDLLTFRASLPTYTYSFAKPSEKQFTGDSSDQRFQFAKYFLQRKPTKPVDGLTPSNVGYVLAGLMLEKASGKSYKTLIGELNELLKINFSFDNPNLADERQIWGHDANLKAIPPKKNIKLNWLLSAGNINADLPDYAKFIQLQLQGLSGKSDILPQFTFENLHFGLRNFSFGWFNKIDEISKTHVSFNEGNAGEFITQVKINKEIDRAFIVFTNSATADTSEGIRVLIETIQKKYGQ